MPSSLNEQFKNSIKKNIYAKAQIAKIIFPPGFSDIALAETTEILNHLWIAKKFTGQIYSLKNEIQIRPVFMLALVELLLRNHGLTDIRLVILKEMALGKKAFEQHCREVNWDFYLNQQMSLKIKVNSIASNAFHENSLKQIIGEVLNPYVKEIVSGEDTDETTTLYVELYKNKLTLSISLAGQPLYKKGYRGQLSLSAPLREDLAASCIKRWLQLKTEFYPQLSTDILFIPFSGTGTFAFEYLQILWQFFPAHSSRTYALEKMPLFKKENFFALIKHAKEISAAEIRKPTSLKVICIDQSKEANNALNDNLAHFKQSMDNTIFPDFTIMEENFFNLNPKDFAGNLFIPLNPPYGIRLNNETSTISFYKKIALKLNEFINLACQNNTKVSGFILCPTEETWSTIMHHLKSAATKTYHFTQGGLDIRACYFFS